MMFRKSLSIICVCLCGLPAALLAQEEVELNPVTVTATLQPVSVSQTGRNLINNRWRTFSNAPGAISG
jgi:hypothetical protein